MDSVHAAGLQYQKRRKIFERRIKKNNDKKGPMGSSTLFGEANENKFVTHIETM